MSLSAPESAGIDASRSLAGVGGWLALLIAKMVVLGPLFSLVAVMGAINGEEFSHPQLKDYVEWGRFKFWSYAVLVGAVGVSVYGGIGLANRRTWDAVARAKSCLWISSVGGSVALGVVVPMAIFGAESIDGRSVFSVIWTAIAAGVWTVYLNRSRRVRNTYPPVGANTREPVHLRPVPHTVSTPGVATHRMNHINQTAPREQGGSPTLTQTGAAARQEPADPPTVPSVTQATMTTVPLSTATEEMWAHALSEFEGHNRRPGIWARAFTEAGGDEKQTKVLYLRYRVSELKAEHDRQMEEQRQRAAEREAAEALSRRAAASIEAEKEGRTARYMQFVAILDDASERSIRDFVDAVPPDELHVALAMKSPMGNTLLHVAAREGYEDLVDLFLRSGADPSIKGPQFKTAYQVAQMNHRDSIAAKLRAASEQKTKAEGRRG